MKAQLQEQQYKINKLKARVRALESENEDLKARVKALEPDDLVPKYVPIHKGHGRWHVESPDGVSINTEYLSKEDAETLAKDMNDTLEFAA